MLIFIYITFGIVCGIWFLYLTAQAGKSVWGRLISFTAGLLLFFAVALLVPIVFPGITYQLKLRYPNKEVTMGFYSASFVFILFLGLLLAKFITPLRKPKAAILEGSDILHKNESSKVVEDKDSGVDTALAVFVIIIGIDQLISMAWKCITILLQNNVYKLKNFYLLNLCSICTGLISIIAATVVALYIRNKPLRIGAFIFSLSAFFYNFIANIVK